MGVRLVVHSAKHGGKGYSAGTHNHDELIHRDWVDQHPIYAITGLQEVLNTIESNIVIALKLINEKETELKDYTDTKIQEESDIINQRIDELNFIDELIDTDSLKLSYNEEKALRGDVIVYTDIEDTNALKRTPDGLYVPKLKPTNTNTIAWDDISYGETIKEIFENGIKFSHNDTNHYNNLYNPSEANAWYWDENLESIIQPLNTESYNGYVSEKLYDNYKHCVCLKSNNNDDDANGLVIGYVIDEYGQPHTLSAMIQKGGNIYLNYRFAIIYNFGLPNQEIIANFNFSNSDNEGGWSLTPNGITLYVTKEGPNITVSATQFNYENNITDILEATDLPYEHTFNIDLRDYSWGSLFKDKVRYGYSNLSQAGSYFSNICFYSKSSKKASEVKARVKIANDINNAIVEREDGLFVSKKPLNISDEHLNGIDYNIQENTYYVHKSHSFIPVHQDMHELKVGDFIYYDTRTMTYQKALAKDNFDINIVGMVNYISDENNFEFICSGFVETDLFNEQHNFVQGMPLYISDENPGEVVQIQPDISKAVGYPIDNIGLVISIERGIQYNQEASIGDFMISANDYNIRSDGYIRVIEDVEYKYNVISKLLNKSDQTFINNYLIIDQENNIIKFKNTNELRIQNGVKDGLNLFIKAF